MDNETEKRDQRLSVHVTKDVIRAIAQTKPRGQSVSQYVDSLLHKGLIKPVKPTPFECPPPQDLTMDGTKVSQELLSELLRHPDDPRWAFMKWGC